MPTYINKIPTIIFTVVPCILILSEFFIYQLKHKRIALTFRQRASCILGQAFRYSPENAFYIFNQQIYFIIWYLLDLHNWYKLYRQPTRCNNNGLLIIPVSSTCFDKLFYPSSGALDCVLQFVVQCTHDVAGQRPATSWGVHYTTSCNTQSSAPEDG